MKKLLFLIFGLMFTHVSMADTINIDWLVDGQTYTQTSCNVGDSITPPTPPTKYGYTFREWRGYTLIEYIESTGTQYIDTGFKPNQDTSVIMTYLALPSARGALFGTRLSESGISYGDVYTGDGKFRSDYNTGEGLSCTLTSDYYSRKLTLHKDKNSSSLSTISNQYLCDVSSNIAIFQINYNLVFPGYNSGGNVSVSNNKYRIYNFKIYDNNTLVRDFAPALDINGTPCMYDKVSRTFFYNAGTGQFVAGPAL